MAGAQCGLCLSCGAPFLPKQTEVVLYNHTGTMSILYIHTQFVESPTQNRTYVKPVLSSISQQSHVIHGSHHEGAVEYMCFHHKGDCAPKKPRPSTNAITGDSCMFPYFKTPTATAKKGPELATWTRPATDKRMDFKVLLDRIVADREGGHDRDAAGVSSSLKEMFPICVPCNSLMTSLGKMRYLMGFTNTANYNPNGCLIPAGEHPISAQEANQGGQSVEHAYDAWKLKRGTHSRNIPTRKTAAEDPLAPHVAYYLHLCLPHSGLDDTVDAFQVPALRGSEITARCAYLELSWLMLEIACLASLLMEGKKQGKNLSHGLHQHLGVVDLYVSYFLWRLLKFEHPKAIQTSGLDFTQWHQKYYCVAIGCRGLGLNHSGSILGTKAFGVTQISTKLLLEGICANLIDLYTGALEPLVMLVTNTLPSPPAVLTKEQQCAVRYFLPLRHMNALRTLSTTKIKENDFDTALELFGIDALLHRVSRLCADEMKPVLRDFRVSWNMIEMDRMRRKNGWSSLRQAKLVMTLCRLLEPPTSIPEQKGGLEELMKAPQCSPWTSVLAMRDLGAFTDG